LRQRLVEAAALIVGIGRVNKDDAIHWHASSLEGTENLQVAEEQACANSHVSDWLLQRTVGRKAPLYDHLAELGPYPWATLSMAPAVLVSTLAKGRELAHLWMSCRREAHALPLADRKQTLRVAAH